MPVRSRSPAPRVPAQVRCLQVGCLSARPEHGVLELPAHLAWTGRHTYDLDDPADRAVLYERVIVEAAAPRDLDLLSVTVLRTVWPHLYLSAPVRALWQTRFPDLAVAT